MSVEVKSIIASFGGKLLKCSHKSVTTGTSMAFNLYLPPSTFSSSSSSSNNTSASTSPTTKKIPLLIWLSGLTCSPDNCAEKGFFQHAASTHSIAILYPDTSPRNLPESVAPGATESWDFGEAASFYVDATKAPWKQHYKMETYLTEELPSVVFGSKETYGEKLDEGKVAISGHSMGGHGAMMLYLRHPGKYVSCSAFAPIANPSACPWGKKAFAGYFGDFNDSEDVKKLWKEHDSTELVKGWKGKGGGTLNMLIDVGTGDDFYKKGQLLPENFAKAADEAGLGDGLELRMQEDYDHSYFFMASFADEHVAHAAKFLKA